MGTKEQPQDVPSVVERTMHLAKEWDERCIGADEDGNSFTRITGITACFRVFGDIASLEIEEITRASKDVTCPACLESLGR